MKILVRSLLLSTALVGAASAQPAPTPAPKKAPVTEKAPAKDAKAPADSKKSEVSPQDVEQFLGFFNKFVDTVVAAKEDCAKLTKDVNYLIDQNAALVKKFQEAKAANKELPQSAKDKMMSRVKEMMPALNKCSSDPGFTAAMKRMEGGKAAAATPPAKTEPAKTEPAKTPAKAPDTKAPAKTPAPK
ncbi:MAG: hypothetical protein M4D80_21340 [Myxococcota bacterium]|nr:hypothetical protein [Deltaproteobacteria bacterium]MDQ3337714.1 hypothetical protein [Myxococcota bacterium]